MNQSMKWVMGCVLLVASWAMAQDVTRPWAVSVKMGLQYTDNRDGTESNKESNVDFYIEPRADLFWRNGERSTLNFYVAPMVKAHSNPREAGEGDPQNDTELFGTVGIDLMHQITPSVKLNVGDTMVYNDDPAINEGGVGERASATHILNTIYGGMGFQITPRVGADVSVRDTIKRYQEESVAQDQDENTLNAEATLGYQLGAGYRTFGLAGYSDFDNESTARDRGSKVYSVGLGLEKIFNPDVHGMLFGGYQSASYADETLDDTDMGNARAEMVFRAQSATRFRVGATYGFFAPYVRPYSLQTLASAQGSIEHDILPARLTVSLRGQYSNGEYERESDALPGGSDNLTLVGLNLSYKINKNWSVGTGYSYENWDSDVRESFDRNYVDANVKAQF